MAKASKSKKAKTIAQLRAEEAVETPDMEAGESSVEQKMERKAKIEKPMKKGMSKSKMKNLFNNI